MAKATLITGVSMKVLDYTSIEESFTLLFAPNYKFLYGLSHKITDIFHSEPFFCLIKTTRSF